MVPDVCFFCQNAILLHCFVFELKSRQTYVYFQNLHERGERENWDEPLKVTWLFVLVSVFPTLREILKSCL